MTRKRPQVLLWRQAFFCSLAAASANSRGVGVASEAMAAKYRVVSNQFHDPAGCAAGTQRATHGSPPITCRACSRLGVNVSQSNRWWEDRELSRNGSSSLMADSPWDQRRELWRVIRREVVPHFEPIEAWIVDETGWLKIGRDVGRSPRSSILWGCL